MNETQLVLASAENVYTYSGVADAGSPYEVMLLPNPVAPAGIGGEMLARTLFLAVTWDMQATLRVTPILDGTRLTAVQVPLAALSTAASRRFKIPLWRTYGATEKATVGVRGTWITFEIATVGAISGTHLIIEGLDLEFDALRESASPAAGKAILIPVPPYPEDPISLRPGTGRLVLVPVPPEGFGRPSDLTPGTGQLVLTPHPPLPLAVWPTGPIFTDGFETGDLTHQEGGASWGVGGQPSLADARSGSFGLPITYTATQLTPGSATPVADEGQLFFLPRAVEAAVEWWVKVPSLPLYDHSAPRLWRTSAVQSGIAAIVGAAGTFISADVGQQVYIPGGGVEAYDMATWITAVSLDGTMATIRDTPNSDVDSFAPRTPPRAFWTDVAVLAGSYYADAPTGTFTAAQVALAPYILIPGAGPNGEDHLTTISYVNGTQVRLGVAAYTTSRLVRAEQPDVASRANTLFSMWGGGPSREDQAPRSYVAVRALGGATTVTLELVCQLAGSASLTTLHSSVLDYLEFTNAGGTGTLQPTGWHRLRLHVKTPTGAWTGARGRLRFWVDDALMLQRNDLDLWQVDLGNGYEVVNGWDVGTLFGAFNSGVPTDTSFVIDDVKIYADDPGWGGGYAPADRVIQSASLVLTGHAPQL